MIGIRIYISVFGHNTKIIYYSKKPPYSLTSHSFVAARVQHSCYALRGESIQISDINHSSRSPAHFKTQSLNPNSSSSIDISSVPMADVMENGTVMTAEEEENEKYGFRRSEMYSSSIANTVDAYDRHVFLCYKNHESWTPRVEDPDSELLPKLLSAAVKARKDDIPVKTKLTVCGGCSGCECSDGDVLIFPAMIKYKGLTESNVESFVDDVLVNGKPWSSGLQEVLSGSYIFVCAHGSRDKRCGVCGPVLIEKLNEGIDSRGLKGQVFVSPCSHIGGHKYAGNLIIYSPDSEGKILGHWYGYVTPDDVSEVLDEHIGKGQVIERLWRGQMGAPPAEGGEKAKKEKRPHGKHEKKGKQHDESSVEEKKETVTGCCQGVNGVSCCQTLDKGIDEKKVEETAPENKCLDKLSLWGGKWEPQHVHAVAAVVGAVAVVAGVYIFYKRSH